ncbi:hypothetical protein [Planctobacterium marinum]|uniref:hypothetical protein n=1 Tax=Planctobacterium marinum TaxID=1631968 RepID=UPI0030C77018
MAVAQSNENKTEPQPKNAVAHASEIENQVTDNAANKSPAPPVSKQASGQNQNIDWGEWALSPLPEYGVGIRGELEAQINQMDQSNLLDNANGVITTPQDKSKSDGTTLSMQDLKKMMAELEAMEAKVKEEIEDDTEF